MSPASARKVEGEPAEQLPAGTAGGSRDGQARPGDWGRAVLDPREPGRRERRVLSPRGFPPTREKAFEAQQPVRTDSASPPGLRRFGGARPPLRVPRPSPRPSVGAPRAQQRRGPRGSEGKGGGTADSGTRARAGGAGALPSGFARHRSHRRSAPGSGLLTIVSGRSRATSPPGPRPLPEARPLPAGADPSEALGERWGRRGGRETALARRPPTPAAPGLHRRRGLGSDFLLITSPGPDVSPFGVSHTPLLEASRYRSPLSPPPLA